MSSDAPLTIIVCARAGGSDDPLRAEAGVVNSLHEAGYATQITRDPAGLLAALDATSGQTIVLVDWTVLGFFAYDDLWRADVYDPLWELSRALEERRGIDHLIGIIALMRGQMRGYGDVFVRFGMRADMYLTCPFNRQELLQFIRRLQDNPQVERREIRDDREPL